MTFDDLPDRKQRVYMGVRGLLSPPSAALRFGQRFVVLSYHERNTRLMFIGSVFWFPETETTPTGTGKEGFVVRLPGIP